MLQQSENRILNGEKWVWLIFELIGLIKYAFLSERSGKVFQELLQPKTPPFQFVVIVLSKLTVEGA